MSDKRIFERFEFRNIKQDEAEEAAEIERICFPPNEACSKKHMKDRVAGIADLFLVAIDKENEKMAGFLNGLATDDDDIKGRVLYRCQVCITRKARMSCFWDWMYCRNTAVRGLQENWYAGISKENVGRGRKEIILTCLESKVAMYEKFGFKDKGIAQSTWGGEEWHEMSVRI